MQRLRRHHAGARGAHAASALTRRDWPYVVLILLFYSMFAALVLWTLFG